MLRSWRWMPATRSSSSRLQDKEASNGGQIRLFFDWPQVQLKEWIISDAQGLNTRIQLAELLTNKDADPKLFTFSPDRRHAQVPWRWELSDSRLSVCAQVNEFIMPKMHVTATYSQLSSVCWNFC